MRQRRIVSHLQRSTQAIRLIVREHRRIRERHNQSCTKRIRCSRGRLLTEHRCHEPATLLCCLFRPQVGHHQDASRTQRMDANGIIERFIEQHL
jgi:hypothetical protein